MPAMASYEKRHFRHRWFAVVPIEVIAGSNERSRVSCRRRPGQQAEKEGHVDCELLVGLEILGRVTSKWDSGGLRAPEEGSWGLGLVGFLLRVTECSSNVGTRPRHDVGVGQGAVE